MTTTWRPTYGLKHAVPIVVALENALIGMGHEVGPVLRWKLTDIVSAALDRAVGVVTDGDPTREASELPIRDTVSEGDMPDFGYPNGLYPNTPSDTDEYRAMFPNDKRVAKTDHVAETKALAETLKAQKPQKRGRGRPKGAKGRKAKAGKTVAPEAAGEAPA